MTFPSLGRPQSRQAFMTKLHDLNVFRTVVRFGNFTAAARILGSTPSSMTKSVTRLETELGVQLLHRTTRAVSLTASGLTYLKACERCLDDLEDAESRLQQASRRAQGHVRLCVPPSFGRMTLIPALDRFFERYPDIELKVHQKAATDNPVESGYDIAVHSGQLSDSRLINRLLVRGPQKTVASPAFLERCGVPDTPERLLDMNCIIGAFGPTWTFRDPTGGKKKLRVSGPFSTDSGDAIRTAAITGLGVAQATWWLFRDDIAAGRLVPVLEDHACEAEPISLVMPGPRKMPQKVRAVCDFIVELCRDF